MCSPPPTRHPEDHCWPGRGETSGDGTRWDFCWSRLFLSVGALLFSASCNFFSGSCIFSSQCFSLWVLELLTVPISMILPLPAVFSLLSSWLCSVFFHVSFSQVSDFLGNLSQGCAAMLYENLASDRWQLNPGWEDGGSETFVLYYIASADIILHCDNLFSFDCYL